MSVLARIMLILLAYLFACFAASGVLTLGTLSQDWSDFNRLGADDPQLQSIAVWTVVVLGGFVIAAVAFLPTLIAVVLVEGLALRSMVIYGVLGALLALALAYGLDFAGYVVVRDSADGRQHEVLAAAGIAGGLVYWLIAGRRAGAWTQKA